MALCIKKSKDYVGNRQVLGSTGAISAGVGLALVLATLEDLFDPDYKDYSSLPDILGYGGLALIAASIPLFIISGKNKRKAKLYLKYQKPHLPNTNNEMKGQMSAGVVINF